MEGNYTVYTSDGQTRLTTGRFLALYKAVTSDLDEFKKNPDWDRLLDDMEATDDVENV